MIDQDALEILDHLEKKIAEMEQCLKACYPFIESHYLRSKSTLGMGALNLMNRIKKLVQIE